jgi:hypothetical protein
LNFIYDSVASHNVFGRIDLP